jgi:hypothetical protein
VGAALLAFAGLGCGRSLPEDEPIATGPVETGAFEEEAPAEGTGAAITGVGTGTPRNYVLEVAEAFRTEDPTATLDVRDAEPDFDALCGGEIDLVATTGDAGEDVCSGEDTAVGFHVASASGEPIVIYVNRESILRFEVEGLIQYAVDNGETLPRAAGAEPLSIDELQETQTKLEQVIAGVA